MPRECMRPVAPSPPLPWRRATICCWATASRSSGCVPRGLIASSASHSTSPPCCRRATPAPIVRPQRNWTHARTASSWIRCSPTGTRRGCSARSPTSGLPTTSRTAIWRTSPHPSTSSASITTAAFTPGRGRRRRSPTPTAGPRPGWPARKPRWSTAADPRPRWAGRSTRTGCTNCSPGWPANTGSRRSTSPRTAWHPTTVRARLHDLLPGVPRESRVPPLYITENGMASDDRPGPGGTVPDKERIDFLDAHLRAAHPAISDGVDLRGYFVWSLLDNFEWALGLERRFGLVHVDYTTQERTLKDSAHWYRQVIQDNGLAEQPPNAAR